MTAFTQTGGARISWVNASWPFATLEVADCELRLKCLWKSWNFRKDQITRLSEYPSCFGGLRIQHNIEKYAPFIVFWTFGYSDLKCALEKRGYIVYDLAN